MDFTVFYKAEDLKNFNFYKFPKALFYEPEYRNLPDSAKILYMIFYDRLNYSLENRFWDENGLVYIFYSINEVMAELGWSREKVRRALACLEENRMIILDRAKRGLKYRIYVAKLCKKGTSTRPEEVDSKRDQGGLETRPPYSNTNNINNNNITKTNSIKKSACARITQTNSKSKDKNRAVGDSS